MAITTKDSIIFAVEWNLKTNDSTFLQEHIYWLSDIQCIIVNRDGQARYRKISGKEHFKVSASIRLFQKLSVVYTEQLTMTGCIIEPYLGELNPKKDPCVNVSFINPCSIIGQ